MSRGGSNTWSNLFVQFVQIYGTKIFREINNFEWVTMKFLIFTLSLVQELHVMQERTADCSVNVRTKSEFGFAESEASFVTEKFVNAFVSALVRNTDLTHLL